MTTKTYIQKDGKVVLKEHYIRLPQGIMIQTDIEPFISPITKEVISSRSHLRIHNKRHGVTDMRDYSHEFMLKRSTERVNEMTGNNPKAKAERIECVKQTLEKFGL